MKAAVVGLGKIGLPLAVQAASRGLTVVGADINPAVVDLVNGGTPPFPGEPGLEKLLAAAVASGNLVATTDVAAASAASDVVVVVVPLVVDAGHRPDFRSIDAATAAIGAALTPGTLVSYETTLPVSTTRDRFAPALEAASGLRSGVDLFVCHSPERVSSGTVFRDLRRYPKIVGGLDDEATRRAVAFYEAVLEFDEMPHLPRPNGVWALASAEAAELTKLAETTYRDVNIALANEFARFADRVGVDVAEVIASANSQPYSHVHQPGIAVGGHCIPVYPRFYLDRDPAATLPAAGRAVNESMPAYALDRLADAVGDLSGLVVVVLGAAYRGGVKETAFSGVFPTVAELRARGATALVHDPLYTDEELAGLGLEAYHLGEACDAAVLQADHAEYATLGPDDLPGVRALLDGRGVVDRARWAGVPVVRIGGGTR